MSAHLLAPLLMWAQLRKPGIPLGFRAQDGDPSEAVLLLDGRPSRFQMKDLKELASDGTWALMGLDGEIEALARAVTVLVEEWDERRKGFGRQFRTDDQNECQHENKSWGGEAVPDSSVITEIWICRDCLLCEESAIHTGTHPVDEDYAELQGRSARKSYEHLSKSLTEGK